MFPGQNPQNYGEYAAMIESVDESVGRVLAALRDAGVDDTTMVVFTADNGGVTSREWKNRPITSNLPLRSGKGHLYEGGIRVPAIVRWPGVTRPGCTTGEPILSIDYAPTLAEAAGIRTSELPPMDGRSFIPALRGEASAVREIFWHYPHYSPQLGRPSAAMRRGDDKLILFFEDDHVELYNLRNDIGESNDLAASQPAKAAAMKRRLKEWLEETSAQLPTPNPNHDPSREREPGAPTGPTTAK